jgi:hypothetical protein
MTQSGDDSRDDEVHSDPAIQGALAEIAKQRRWPTELTRRVAELRVPLASLYSWTWYGLSPDQTAAQLRWYERMTTGDLRARDATYADNEEFSALWSDSPEEIAGWEIIVERGPDAFAQFRLQQNVQIPILSISSEIVACCAFSRRKVLIDGRPFSVQYGQALRVRRAYRRLGYGDQVRRLAAPPGLSRPSIGQYDIMRSQNFAVVNWWQKYSPQFFENTPTREGSVPGLPIAVSQFPADARSDNDRAIRAVRREDLSACAALINRTHAGLDLFRPYSAEFLEDVLDEGFWGECPKPTGNPMMDWWKSVYGWTDYFVLEEAGRIRACGGLWDRGRDMREQWRRIGGDEHRSIAIACVLDFGYEDGGEECMARLLRWMIGRAYELGREYLAIPIEHLTKLAATMEKSRPELDTRALRWGLKDPPSHAPLHGPPLLVVRRSCSRHSIRKCAASLPLWPRRHASRSQHGLRPCQSTGGRANRVSRHDRSRSETRFGLGNRPWPELRDTGVVQSVTDGLASFIASRFRNHQ